MHLSGTTGSMLKSKTSSFVSSSPSQALSMTRLRPSNHSRQEFQAIFCSRAYHHTDREAEKRYYCPVISRYHVNFSWPSTSRFSDGLRTFLTRCCLKGCKCPIKNTFFDPAISAVINAMPIAKVGWQASPLAAVLCYIQNCV